MVYRAAYRKQNILGLDSQSRVCHNQMKPKIQGENPLSQTLTCYHLCTFSAFFPLIISQYQSMEEILGRILRKKKSILTILSLLGELEEIFIKNIPTISILHIKYYKIEQNVETILNFHVI